MHETDTPLFRLIEQLGQATAVHAYRRGLTAIGQLEGIAEELADKSGFRRVPSLYLASDDEGQRQIDAEYACRKDFGFQVRHLDRHKLSDISSIQAPCALWSVGNAQINPYLFTLLLVERLRQRGLRAFSQTHVAHVQRHSQRLELHTPSGVIGARYLVFALGYAGESILPLSVGDLNTTYAAASEPIADFDGWPDHCQIWETARPYFYARQTEDSRIVIGGADSSRAGDHASDQMVNRQTQLLMRKYDRLFPAIPFHPAFRWAGTFGESPDSLARMGRLPGREREFAVMAYGGNGTTYSMIAARLVADLIVGRPNEDAPVFQFAATG